MLSINPTAGDRFGAETTARGWSAWTPPYSHPSARRCRTGRLNPVRDARTAATRPGDLGRRWAAPRARDPRKIPGNAEKPTLTGVVARQTLRPGPVSP